MMTPRTPRGSQKSGFFRYLPAHPESVRWGAFVTTAGFASVRPDSPYPPFRHPEDHHFRWEAGRVLSAFRMILLTRGRGRLETADGGCSAVAAGDLFILRPLVWHRYRPDPTTGWDEYWVELDGPLVRRLMGDPPLGRSDPVFHTGLREDLLAAYLDTLDLLRRKPPGVHLLLSAQAVHHIAVVRAALEMRVLERKSAAEMVSTARALLDRQAGHLKLEAIAAQLGVSYSQFRRMFKNQTGFAPLQYALESQHRRACFLLANTDQSVGRIAAELGFTSLFYFSRQFKSRAGLAPLRYRARHSRRKL